MASPADVAGREGMSEAFQDRRRKATSAHRHERAFTLPGENAARQISLFSPAQLVVAEHA